MNQKSIADQETGEQIVSHEVSFVPKQEIGRPSSIQLSGTANIESERVQAVRGLACLLLVAFHVIGSQDTSGLQVAPDSVYRAFANFMTFIRMPLFTFLSGFVYAYRPALGTGQFEFALKKLRRLMLPLLAAATIIYLGHMLAHDTEPVARFSDIWRIYLFPYQHFWFLQGLLIVFMLTIFLERNAALATPMRFLLVLGAALLLFAFEPFEENDFFSIYHSTYLLPFFLLGIGANRFRTSLFSPTGVVLAIGVFVVGQGIQVYDVLGHYGDAGDKRSLLAIAVGFSAALCAVRWLPRPRLLQQIGGYSFVIYLYHPIFPAAVRMAGKYVGGLPLSVLFWTGLSVGIAGPFVIERTVRWSRLGRLLFLGQKWSG